MSRAIPRGIVYHRLQDDIKWLLQACYKRLDEKAPIHEFEQEFATLTGRSHCVAFPFARTAIHCALKSRRLPAGSRIVMPPITIKAILDVVLDLGLLPIFVDIDPDTLCFDLEKLRAVTDDNTRAILVTYLFGMVPNMAELTRLARSRDWFVIEDFSQCLNGRFDGKTVGSFGDVGVYSASSIKPLDTYGGGLLVCDDNALSQQLRTAQQELTRPRRSHLIKKIVVDMIRNAATQRLMFHWMVFPLVKMVQAFRPGSVLKHTGERSMARPASLPVEWFESYTSFQASVGLETIGAVEQQDEKRRGNVAAIKAGSPVTEFPSGVPGGHNVYWQLVAFYSQPQSVQRHFFAHNIDTATTSLLKISSLPDYPCRGNTPNADRLYSNGLFIPCFPGLGACDIERIVDTLNIVEQHAD